MSEKIRAIRLANKILDTPHKDPDDNESILARQFFRSLETIEAMHRQLQQVDWNGMAQLDLINANRYEVLKMHREAIRRIRKHLESGSVVKAVRVIDALNLYHPMHCESWEGWGDE